MSALIRAVKKPIRATDSLSLDGVVPSFVDVLGGVGAFGFVSMLTAIGEPVSDHP
jgi:hypothetical protein